MAETREGGVYLVRGKWVDAEGKETDEPRASDAEKAKPEPVKAETKDADGNKVSVPMPYASLLEEAGYGSPEAVRKASDEDLLAIEGIGPTRLAEIRAYKP